MTVIASFIAVPSSGLLPPSESVQFTDTSEGNPDNWLWDFGDGAFSSEQHPEHTFTGDVGDSFTVKLKAFIASGSTMNVINFSSSTRQGKVHADTTNAGAFNLLVAASWIGPPLATFGEAQISLERVAAANFKYSAFRHTLGVSVPPQSDVGPSVAVVQALVTGFDDLHGTITSSIGGSISGIATWDAFLDVTDSLGTAIPNVTFEPTIASIPDPAIGQEFGISATFRVKEFGTASNDNFDEAEGVIAFGVSPVADFTGNPTAGHGQVSVQFENLSTPAIGLPTTYSWKRRLSGSGDAFVEFSTEENPIETFTK